MLAFTRTDLERLFPSTTWQRAKSLRDQSAVVEINVERDGRSITGRVRGERRTPFLTRVNIVNGRGGRIRLSSTCTCLVYSECEHAAATLLAAWTRPRRPEADEVGAAIDPELEAWIAAINQSARALPNGHAGDGADCVLYTARAGAAPVARFGLDPAAGGEHVPRPAAARRRLRPRAPAGDVQPGGRGPGQLRRVWTIR